MSHGSSDNDAALITILNSMYNNNMEQLAGLNSAINNLNSINSHIREQLVQLLRNSHRRPNRNNNNNNNNRQYQGNNNTYRNFDYNLYGQYDFNYIAPTSRYRRPSFDNNDNHQYQFSVNNNNNNRQNARFFDPVPVFPTQTQIELATRRARFSDIVSPRNMACPISMAEFNDTDIVTVIRHCGHVFATDQLNVWFATHCTCPVCRFDIRTAPVNNMSAITIDPSGNRPHVERVSRSQSPIDTAIVASPTATLDNLFSPITEAVTRILTDMSGNYTYSNSDPIAVFELLYHMNNTSPRNS